MTRQQRSCAWHIIAAVTGSLFLLAATVQAQSTIYLAGAGSSLVATVFSAWTNDFNRKNTTIQAGYFPLNSAEAINQIKAHFGGFRGRRNTADLAADP